MLKDLIFFAAKLQNHPVISSSNMNSASIPKCKVDSKHGSSVEGKDKKWNQEPVPYRNLGALWLPQIAAFYVVHHSGKEPERKKHTNIWKQLHGGLRPHVL